MIQIHHLSKIMMDQMVSAEAFHHSGHYGSLSPTSLQLGHHDSSKGKRIELMVGELHAYEYLINLFTFRP